MKKSFLINSNLSHPVFYCKVNLPLRFFPGFLLLFLTTAALSQVKEKAPTGYLPDAAEEYWPLVKNNTGKHNLYADISHISIRNGKGFLSFGGSGREVYEYFNNYLWGKGVQDNNGYFLHRILAHGDVRYSSHLRFFGELQSSFLSGRNGGPRPVQDLNKLSATQAFIEYSFAANKHSVFRLRIGKQTLNYGVGSLLDIRDTNVRRSFVGGKLIFQQKASRLDLFYMELVKTNPGFFDDEINHNQKIAGAWLTQNLKNGVIKKIDLFYLYTFRNPAIFNQGAGIEKRHTMGGSLNFAINNWGAFSEADLQLGKFDGSTITAWKITQTANYQFKQLKLRPNFSIQTAISSGDQDPKKNHLQTFNPVYPKAIYYGFIDNVGSANIMLVHAKVEAEPTDKIKITGGAYMFWRQSLHDGLYSASGSYFLPASNQARFIGNMFDLVAAYSYNSHIKIQSTIAYYKRGPFLKEMFSTNHDIFYAGLMLNVHF